MLDRLAIMVHNSPTTNAAWTTFDWPDQSMPQQYHLDFGVASARPVKMAQSILVAADPGGSTITGMTARHSKEPYLDDVLRRARRLGRKLRRLRARNVAYAVVAAAAICFAVAVYFFARTGLEAAMPKPGPTVTVRVPVPRATVTVTVPTPGPTLTVRATSSSSSGSALFSVGTLMLGLGTVGLFIVGLIGLLLRHRDRHGQQGRRGDNAAPVWAPSHLGQSPSQRG
jgi:hypothetical protein